MYRVLLMGILGLALIYMSPSHALQVQAPTQVQPQIQTLTNTKLCGPNSYGRNYFTVHIFNYDETEEFYLQPNSSSFENVVLISELPSKISAAGGSESFRVSTENSELTTNIQGTLVYIIGNVERCTFKFSCTVYLDEGNQHTCQDLKVTTNDINRCPVKLVPQQCADNLSDAVAGSIMLYRE